MSETKRTTEVTRLSDGRIQIVEVTISDKWTHINAVHLTAQEWVDAVRKLGPAYVEID